MSCLSIKITLGQSTRMAISLSNPLQTLRTHLLNKPLCMSTRIVCGLPEYYLIVKPDVVWLTEANGFEADFEVKSNTNWKIE